MNLSNQQLWERFQRYYTEFPTLEMALDLSRMNFAEDFWDKMEPRIQKAFAAMAELERGAIANPDENRMVGHYWLRNPALAPTPEIRREIEETVGSIKRFAEQVHTGKIQGSAGMFKNLLLIGIGGSALGPQFVSHALSYPLKDKMRLFTFDNTDPDGIDRVLANIGTGLGETLCLVVSKSGGTKETRNGMLEAMAAFGNESLDFGKHAVAITQAGSDLDKFAKARCWIKSFPMWDWVGGRTSELSAVGLVPAALQGFDIDSLLIGASTCDEITRNSTVKKNPAAQLALSWYHSGNGIGWKSMVILPYKDRLELFSRYLQQLVMESLGKEKDRMGSVVKQGITVFGNKGSTDQHSYVQQLREGIDNFFVTFIEVLQHRESNSIRVDANICSGDYLMGFLLGTRSALYENDRESLTLTIRKVSAFSIGMLIALFERAVGLYAELINVNAYHQPGVEAGKKAAANVVSLQEMVINCMSQNKNTFLNVEQIGKRINSLDDLEPVFKICEQLAANIERGIVKQTGKTPFESKYALI